MKRFLVTTAEERTWRKDLPMLFLGAWCLRGERRKEWDELDFVVASSLNGSAEDRNRAVAQVQALTGQLLPELAEGLNRFHGVRHTKRYWNILLGHWLQRWVSTAYIRYLTLKRALDEYEVEGTSLMRPLNYSLATKDTLAFIWATNDDLWNHVLWGEVLAHFKEITPTYVETADTSLCYVDGASSSPSNLSVKGVLRSIASKVLPQLAGKSDAFIINSYLPISEEVRLSLVLKQIPQRWQTPAINFPFPGDRKTLANELSDSGKSDVEGFIRNLLPKVLPTCFVEGYQTLSAKSASLPWPSKPRFIFTSNNFDTDEVFKAWAALKSEQGTPYFSGQHGNNYGTHVYFGNRNWPERSAVDGFLTWGWTDNDPNTIAAFNLKNASEKLILDPNGGLLLIETSVEHSCVPWDVTADHIKYLNNQFDFVSALPQQIFEFLTVRLPVVAERFSHCEQSQWNERHPGLKIDNGRKPFASLLSLNRLVVFSYDSTGVLEMLDANKPFICFWSGKWDHLQESAIPYYELLFDSGIYQESPEKAAKMVADIWEDIPAWWNCAKVQRARVNFCERYSRSSKDRISTLAKLMNQAVNRP